MSSLKARAITGFIFGAVVLLCIYGGEVSSIFLFGIVCLFSSFELARMLRRDVQDIWMILTLLVGVVPFVLSFYYQLKGQELNSLIIFSCVVICFYIYNMLTQHPIKYFEKFAPLSALLYLGIPFAILRLVLLKPPFQWELLLSIILLIWSSDSFAYLIGSKFGKHKLYPAISPGKTWEGFLGAGICNIAVAILLFMIFDNYSIVFYIILGITVWFIGSIGDLYQSYLKRFFKLKDSGSFLPGHGGFLDRFDSFIFVIPFVALLLMLFNLI